MSLMTPKKRAKEWMDLFLAAFANTGNVRFAAREAGVSRQEVYRIKGLDAEFAERFDDARDEAMDMLELECRRRAFQGVKKERWVRTGTDPKTRLATYEKIIETEYSDILMIFLLKGGRPDVYRDNFDHKGMLAAYASVQGATNVDQPRIAKTPGRKRST